MPMYLGDSTSNPTTLYNLSGNLVPFPCTNCCGNSCTECPGGVLLPDCCCDDPPTGCAGTDACYCPPSTGAHPGCCTAGAVYIDVSVARFVMTMDGYAEQYANSSPSSCAGLGQKHEYSGSGSRGVPSSPTCPSSVSPSTSFTIKDVYSVYTQGTLPDCTLGLISSSSSTPILSTSFSLSTGIQTPPSLTLGAFSCGVGSQYGACTESTTTTYRQTAGINTGWTRTFTRTQNFSGSPPGSGNGLAHVSSITTSVDFSGLRVCPGADMGAIMSPITTTPAPSKSKDGKDCGCGFRSIKDGF